MPDQSTSDTVVCSRCDTAKPRDGFTTNVAKTNGLNSWCRACVSEYGRQRRAESPKRDRQQSHYERPEGASCTKCGEWKSFDDFPPNPRKSNGLGSHCRVCSRAAHRDWRARNPGYEKAWRERNPERAAAHDAARTASRTYREQQAEGSVRAEIVERIWARDGRRCLSCGSEKRLTLDHIVPLSKGGTNRPDNLQTLCMPCNSKKGTKVIDYRTPQNSEYLWW